MGVCTIICTFRLDNPSLYLSMSLLHDISGKGNGLFISNGATISYGWESCLLFSAITCLAMNFGVEGKKLEG